MAHRTLLSIISHLREIRNSVLLFIVLLFIGTLFYSRIEGWNLIDSLYFSVATVTTVGYGDLHPTHDITKLFTIAYILVGFGVVLYILTSIVTNLLERKDKQIMDLEKKIIRLEENLKNP